MSCYFRHLRDVFAEAGIPVPTTRTQRQRLDACIADLVGDADQNVVAADHHCPTTWKRIKAELADAEARRAFVARLAEAAGSDRSGG